jgi:hypothetical protein
VTSLFPSIPIVGIDFSIRACFISFEMEILGDEDDVDLIRPLTVFDFILYYLVGTYLIEISLNTLNKNIFH